MKAHSTVPKAAHRVRRATAGLRSHLPSTGTCCACHLRDGQLSFSFPRYPKKRRAAPIMTIRSDPPDLHYKTSCGWFNLLEPVLEVEYHGAWSTQGVVAGTIRGKGRPATIPVVFVRQVARHHAHFPFLTRSPASWLLTLNIFLGPIGRRPRPGRSC